jgi:hypothetical protein
MSFCVSTRLSCCTFTLNSIKRLLSFMICLSEWLETYPANSSKLPAVQTLESNTRFSFVIVVIYLVLIPLFSISIRAFLKTSTPTATDGHVESVFVCSLITVLTNLRKECKSYFPSPLFSLFSFI